MAEQLSIAEIKKRLRTLERRWPKGTGLMLFADGNALRLCTKHPQAGGRVIESFAILNDGGDPDWQIEEDDR